MDGEEVSGAVAEVGVDVAILRAGSLLGNDLGEGRRPR